MSAKIIAVDELATVPDVGRLLECNTKASTGDALPFLSDNTPWGSLPLRHWPFSGLPDRLACEMASVTRISPSSAIIPTCTALRLPIACA
jgi:hypothetical protein